MHKLVDSQRVAAFRSCRRVLLRTFTMLVGSNSNTLCISSATLSGSAVSKSTCCKLESESRTGRNVPTADQNKQKKKIRITHFVDNGNNRDILTKSKVEIGDGLRLDALGKFRTSARCNARGTSKPHLTFGGVDEQQSSLTSSKRTADLWREVTTRETSWSDYRPSRGVDEVQQVPVVEHRDRLRLYRDPSVPLDLQLVEDLLVLARLCNSARDFQQSVGQR
ncbi:MAG: hypothetical protein BJ554DRAFT_1433 [Olpidium bornovanus]|uniref:Uncharacterized protein n=1 Tax=Olpidium bornovanus TaxID=278681 RepID=A0A8H7ZS29_9FUNG|nr:MAG: hypothetical protein BJ554DRAFT_1433 [Olpidium bornovanus]